MDVEGRSGEAAALLRSSPVVLPAIGDPEDAVAEEPRYPSVADEGRCAPAAAVFALAGCATKG